MLTANGIYETTTSIGGTLGNGAVTLIQVTNVPRVSYAFNRTANLRYIIEKISTGQLEVGYGTFASNVLTRNKQIMTYDGATTWNDINPTPLQFGSSPTSGDVIIRLAALADDKAPIIDVRQTSVTGDATWRDYYFSEAIGGDSAGTAATLTANREYYLAFKCGTPGTLLALQMEVTTAVAASNIAIALYELGTDPTKPVGAKITDFAGFSTASTGVKTDSSPASWTPAGAPRLEASWLVIGFIASHAIGIRCRVSTNAQHTPWGRFNSYGHSDTIYAAGSGTTLPAVPSPTTMLAMNSANGASAWMGLKIAP